MSNPILNVIKRSSSRYFNQVNMLSIDLSTPNLNTHSPRQLYTTRPGQDARWGTLTRTIKTPSTHANHITCLTPHHAMFFTQLSSIKHVESLHFREGVVQQNCSTTAGVSVQEVFILHEWSVSAELLEWKFNV